VSALVGGLSLAVLTFDEFHPTQSSLARAAEGSLCSSALTAVIAVMVSTMLLFRFEGCEMATRKDLAIAWTPLVLLDLSIIEFLLGLMFWYAGKNTGWRAAVMGTQLAVLLVFSIWTAVGMWRTMSKKGGLGQEESQISAETKRVADD
jgi:hypothetical protein